MWNRGTVSCLMGQHSRCGYQTDVRDLAGPVFFFYFNYNHAVWFCLYLCFAIRPHVCPLLYPLSALTAEPWQQAYICEVKPKVRASKAHTASGGPSHQITVCSSWPRTKGADCRRVPSFFFFFSLFEGFNTEARVGVLKSKVLSWRAAQMSRSVSSAFIRSDGDRRSVSRRRFSTLEMLQEDMKSLLRETRTTGLLSSPLTNVLPRVFMTCSLAIIQCMHLLHMGMHLVWWDGWDDSKNPDITPCSLMPFQLLLHSRVFSLGKLCHGSVTCQMIPTTYLKEIPLRVPAATACLLDAFYHAAGDVLHAQCKVLKRRRYRCTG